MEDIIFETYDNTSGEMVYRDRNGQLQKTRIDAPNYNAQIVEVESIDGYEVLVTWDNGQKTTAQL